METKSQKQEAVDNILEMTKELGYVPPRTEYHRHPMCRFGQRRIAALFGSFSDFLMAAGVHHLRLGDRHTKEKATREREKYESLAKMQEVFKTELLPFFNKYQAPQGRKITRYMIGSDLHEPYADPFCREVFIDACVRCQPDVIVLAGDMIDFYPISKFTTDPSRKQGLQKEIDTLVAFLRRLRSGCPKAQIDWFMGNHEFRMVRDIYTRAPEYATLDNLQFSSLFRLDELRVNFVAQPSMLTQDGKDPYNWKIYEDCLCITHGKKTTKHTACAELDKWGMPGASGHKHGFQVFMKHTLREVMKWYSLPCMCLPAEYTDFDVASRGFAQVHVYRNRPVFETFDLDEPLAVVAGKYYFR